MATRRARPDTWWPRPLPFRARHRGLTAGHASWSTLPAEVVRFADAPVEPTAPGPNPELIAVEAKTDGP